MNYPEEIESTFLELASFDERIKQVRAKVRSLELQITLDVTTAKDPETGKLLLSNDKQREGAIASTLAESEDYAQLATEISNLEQDKIKLQARLERLRMEFKLHLLDCEEQVHLTTIRAIDAIFAARQENYQFPQEVELPF